MAWLRGVGSCSQPVRPLRVLGQIPGIILAAAAIYAGKKGLDSKGRNLALIALIAGVLLIGIYLTVLIVGNENIGIMPT